MMIFDIKKIIHSLSTFLKSLLQLFAILAIVVNTYVVFMLVTTNKFNIVLNDINVNGNFAIAIALVLILITILNLCNSYNNIIFNILAKSFATSTALYIYKICFGAFNDDGLIIKNRFFAVYHNYSLDEKLAWRSRAEIELNISIDKLNLENVSDFNSYNEFKNAIMAHLAELKRLAELQLQQNTHYSYFSATLDWFFTHKLLCTGFVVIVGAGLYMYMNGYFQSSILNIMKKTNNEVADINSRQISMNENLQTLRQELQRVNNVLQRHIQSSKHPNVTHHSTTNTVNVEYIQEHFSILEDTMKISKKAVEESIQTLDQRINGIIGDLAQMSGSLSHLTDNTGQFFGLDNLLKSIKSAQESIIKLDKFNKIYSTENLNEFTNINTRIQVLSESIKDLDANVRLVLTNHDLNIAELQNSIAYIKTHLPDMANNLL